MVTILRLAAAGALLALVSVPAGASPLLATSRPSGLADQSNVIRVHQVHDDCKWEEGWNLHRHVGPRGRVVECGKADVYYSDTHRYVEKRVRIGYDRPRYYRRPVHVHYDRPHYRRAAYRYRHDYRYDRRYDRPRYRRHAHAEHGPARYDRPVYRQGRARYPDYVPPRYYRPRLARGRYGEPVDY